MVNAVIRVCIGLSVVLLTLETACAQAGTDIADFGRPSIAPSAPENPSESLCDQEEFPFASGEKALDAVAYLPLERMHFETWTVEDGNARLIYELYSGAAGPVYLLLMVENGSFGRFHIDAVFDAGRMVYFRKLGREIIRTGILGEIAERAEFDPDNRPTFVERLENGLPVAYTNDQALAM